MSFYIRFIFLMKGIAHKNSKEGLLSFERTFYTRRKYSTRISEIILGEVRFLNQARVEKGSQLINRKACLEFRWGKELSGWLKYR
jgi:hypothetical protein